LEYVGLTEKVNLSFKLSPDSLCVYRRFRRLTCRLYGINRF
jgi:hypothetical protein